ncbi:hypothetical protein NPIL_593821 [Nephila pilipes]|uniref:Uncharacterized protein n=1 Tax=Nephila pilipes TaxID=299642 RepID=A0A8X6NLT8_NEPPI|nr:hypothetical protein NPIL_593821 [Nephila pilipes]
MPLRWKCSGKETRSKSNEAGLTPCVLWLYEICIENTQSFQSLEPMTNYPALSEEYLFSLMIMDHPAEEIKAIGHPHLPVNRDSDNSRYSSMHLLLCLVIKNHCTENSLRPNGTVKMSDE